MRRIHTVAVSVAKVVEVQALGDRADETLVGETMGRHVAAVELELSVTGMVQTFLRPQPAAAVTHGYLRAKQPGQVAEVKITAHMQQQSIFLHHLHGK